MDQIERFLFFNCIGDISAMFVCLPDVQDQISGYLVVITHLLHGSGGILIIIEHLLLYQFRGITLGNSGLQPCS